MRPCIVTYGVQPDREGRRLKLAPRNVDTVRTSRDCGTRAARSDGALLTASVVLIALNLRPAITSVSALLREVQASLTAPSTWLGALTTVPALCFAAAGSVAPWVARRTSLGSAISTGLIMLIIGLLVRARDSLFYLVGGTLLAMAGVALLNVLIPVVVKGSFPARVGLMTGLYTAALQGGATLGAALTPSLDDKLGSWQRALQSWAFLAIVALTCWLIVSRTLNRTKPVKANTADKKSLLRSPLAWTITLFFGAHSFFGYVIMGWLPEVFIDNGISKSDAGLLLGLMTLIAMPLSLIICSLAARQINQSGWIVGLSLFGIAGVIGLAIAPVAAPLLWSVLVGVGMVVFSLSLAVITLRSRNADDAARLSGMAQGWGYLLACTGPLFFGLLHDMNGGWTASWIMVLAACLAQLLAGVVAGRNCHV